MESSIANRSDTSNLSPGGRKKKMKSLLPKSKFKMIRTPGKKKRKEHHDDQSHNDHGGGDSVVGDSGDDHVPNNITTRTTTMRPRVTDTLEYTNNRNNHDGGDDLSIQQPDLSSLQNVLSNDEFVFTHKIDMANTTKRDGKPSDNHDDIKNNIGLSFDTVQTAPPRLEPRVLYDVHHQQQQQQLGQRYLPSSASSVSSLSTSMSRNYSSISARRINTVGDADEHEALDDQNTTAQNENNGNSQDEAEARQDLVKRAVFNSVKLRRLEELKRYQQYDHESCYSYLLKEYEGNGALASPPPSPLLPRSPTLPNNHLDTTATTSTNNNDKNNYNNTTNSLPGSSNSAASSHQLQGSLSPPSSPSQISTSHPPSALSSWETTRHTLMEDYLMTFIDKSPYRITFTAMFFMMLLYCVLSIDSTATSFMEAGDNVDDSYNQCHDAMMEAGPGSVGNVNMTATAATTATPAKTAILEFIPRLLWGRNNSENSTIGEDMDIAAAAAAADTEGSSTTDTSMLQIVASTILQLLSSIFGALLSKSHLYKRIFKNIIAFGIEIFATNMKTFVFVILYGILLDIIFISAFDNVNIPIIVTRLKTRGGIVREERGESDSNEQASANSTISGSSSESGNIVEGKKNPIIRQFAIENIRKATAGVALGIVGCGLVKGILYTLLYHLICTVDHLCSFCALVKDSLVVSVLSSVDDGNAIDNSRGLIATRVTQKLVEWNEQIVQIPFKLIRILLRVTIQPLCYYSGVSWMCTTLYTSIRESSSFSICTQIIDVMKNLMMYIGVFVLTFYLILVHIYPGKVVSSGAVSDEVGNQNMSTRVTKEEEKIRTQ